jgi:RNA polymerase sigma factor (sigma-70 family)
MQREVEAAHGWEALVAALDMEQGWGLAEVEQARYVAALRAYLPTEATAAEVRRVCAYYHQDHGLVAALRDQNHPQHSPAWDTWTQLALQTLYGAGLARSSDHAHDAHDLAQAALVELTHALPTFRYQSRLETWMHAVVVRTARRLYRDSHAKKRPQQCASLTQLPEFDQPVPMGDHPETATDAKVLRELVWTALTSTADERMARIFFLHAVEDCATEAIGQRVQLHPSRVRALLAQARAILQNHPGLQAWIAN